MKIGVRPKLDLTASATAYTGKMTITGKDSAGNIQKTFIIDLSYTKSAAVTPTPTPYGPRPTPGPGWPYGPRPTPIPGRPTPRPEPTPPGGGIYGDVNDDGVRNNADLILMLNFFSGANVSINRIKADFNGDGKLDQQDLVKMLRWFCGRDTTPGRR
jgi:hypothetical protein